jgi:two-component system, NtrC family, sensor histidine kinase HydH
MMTRRSWLTLLAALLGAWGGIAYWQYDEFVRERELSRDVLRQQATAVHQALAAGIRSHRRLGRFFEEQVQGMLDELIETPGVIAVRITDGQGAVMSSGKVDEFEESSNRDLWQPQGLQTTDQIEVTTEPAGPPAGRGPPWRLQTNDPSSKVSRFTITLLSDRTTTDATVARAARLRTTLAAGGGLVIASIALVWLAHSRTLVAAADAEKSKAETCRLQELNQAAAGLAHETRNPLGLIRGNLQRLANERGDAADDRGQFQVLIEECDRVTARINQFLAFARPQSPVFQAVDLKAMASELQSLLEPDLEAKGASLRIADASAGRASADPELLRQILFNLLQNAIAFSPNGAAVDVRFTAKPTGLLQIDVADSGPGVDLAAQASLFTPYFTTRPGGAGLGLAIVGRLVHAHGWKVSYVDRPGGGANFRIEGIRVENKS